MVENNFTFGSLFAGIGGFDLGLERAGMACKWQVEIEPFCLKVLAKHWPNVKRYEDIKDVGKHNLESVDLACGGFPCQPFSVAGKQRGKEDDRYLWPEMLRVISEIKPTWIIGENVPGIINVELDKVLSDLENQGYETQPLTIPACAVDAPHRRDRVWIVAHSNGIVRRKGGENSTAKQSRYRKSIQRKRFVNDTWLPEPGVGRVANGIPRRVDRLRALGNAVVPQVVEVIGKLIMEVERDKQKATTTPK